ncbi:MAG: hypothetical protein H0W95_00215 [Nocardioidaceae bacterium]|nr:hypothetical protein [Nocardioidaceae bacterium]
MESQHLRRKGLGTRRSAALVAGLATTALTLSLATPASAKVLERGTFHDEGSFRERNLCEVPGFRVRVDFVIDGTSTILVLATGNSLLYGSTGKAVARNPGQVRFEILVDNGGTPQDPFDDEFLEFLGVVKESTGRSDDYCAATVEAIG